MRMGLRVATQAQNRKGFRVVAGVPRHGNLLEAAGSLDQKSALMEPKAVRGIPRIIDW